MTKSELEKFKLLPFVPYKDLKFKPSGYKPTMIFFPNNDFVYLTDCKTLDFTTNELWKLATLYKNLVKLGLLHQYFVHTSFPKLSEVRNIIYK